MLSVYGVLYEEIRDFGGGHITSIGSTIITNLDGAFSADTVSSSTHKVPGFFAVSSSYRARCDFRSSSAASHSRVTRK